MEHEERAPADHSMGESEQEAAKAAGWYMWPVGEKGAAAIKSFVKDRSVDVSNAIRKLSAKMEDLDREVFDKGFDYMALRISKPTETPVEQVQRADPPLNVKGRIVFFSMSGCDDCRAVRSLLRRKGLPYVEINVDVYPHRKLELEERTGTSSLPQVFFNEVFVGGIDELKAMEASRELDEKLKQVFEHECPSTAPQPPASGEEIDSLTGNKDNIAEVAERLKEKVQIKDRLHKIHWFTRCFLGSEAVSILAENENCSREEAVELGKKLASKFFFQHVLMENNFEDENHLYRFLEHDPVVMTYCFNFEGKSLIKAFGPKDNRLKVSLQEQTPLIHFALSCATKSSPAINCYTSANIDAELRFAARRFFREGGIVINMETRTVMLNQIMNWYSVDFGNLELEKLKWIVDYLEPAKAEDLMQLLEGEFKVLYEPYDWSPNI